MSAIANYPTSPPAAGDLLIGTDVSLAETRNFAVGDLLALAGYLHTQASAAAAWTINHNLGFQPDVAVRTVGGVEIDTQVVHTSLNQVIVYLNSALAGTARCS